MSPSRRTDVPSRQDLFYPTLKKVAVHEAGHAVASVFLGRAIRGASIQADEGSEGRVENYRHGSTWVSRLEDADHAASWGGFIDGRTRRSVEIEIMILLAGGLVAMTALGARQHDVGMGLTKLSMAESATMADKYGGDTSDWQILVSGGDYKQAMELALKASGIKYEHR